MKAKGAKAVSSHRTPRCLRHSRTEVTINGRFWVTAETALIQRPKRLVYLGASITSASAPRIRRLVVWNYRRSYWTPASASPESICLNKSIIRSGAARAGKPFRTGYYADCLWSWWISRRVSSLSSQRGQVADDRRCARDQTGALMDGAFTAVRERRTAWQLETKNQAPHLDCLQRPG
jgi:hypothetical protein